MVNCTKRELIPAQKDLAVEDANSHPAVRPAFACRKGRVPRGRQAATPMAGNVLHLFLAFGRYYAYVQLPQRPYADPEVLGAKAIF